LASSPERFTDILDLPLFHSCFVGFYLHKETSSPSKGQIQPK
jgi:hypothetical protein